MIRYKELRREFNILTNRCSCSKAYLKRECYPPRCYPRLYKFLYPDGGQCRQSYMIKRKKGELKFIEE